MRMLRLSTGFRVMRLVSDPSQAGQCRNSAMAGEGMGSAEIRNGLTGQQVWAGLCRAGLKSFPGAGDVF